MAHVHRRETRFLRVWRQVTRHLPRNRVEQSPESAQLNLGFEASSQRCPVRAYCAGTLTLLLTIKNYPKN